MRLVIRVAGAAGLGMNSTADIIVDVAAELGYLVNTDIEYQSLIKGGLNYFDIFISDESKYISKNIDILIALDEKNLDANLAFFVSPESAIIIANNKWIQKLTEKGKDFSHYHVLGVDIEDKYENTYLIAIIAKILQLPDDILGDKITKIFKKKGDAVVEKNKEIYHRIKEHYTLPEKLKISPLQRVGTARDVTYGNKVLAYGAIDNGLEYYSAYPMTPASSVLTEVIKSKKVTYHQAEDEIAVMNSALGASFTGARSMVGTSGGGFALMIEAISFAIQAEFGIVMILSQRAGPSTGTPTYHEQGDLNMALNPSFGDFDHIVVCPSTLEDGYYLSGYCLNLAQKYQTVVILLSDKQYSDGKATFETSLTTPGIDRGKLIENPSVGYKRYELTDDGVSPYVKPGVLHGDFIATSYEHDEYGATTEEREMKIKMTEKRFKKLKDFYKKEGIFGYELINGGARKIIITTSYTSYTAKEFVKNNPNFGLMIIKILKPIDERILEVLHGKEEVIFVESNYSGQLENYIVKEFGLKYVPSLKISHLRKYDLFPFYYEDFETLKH